MVLPLSDVCDSGCPGSVQEALDELAAWACRSSLGEVTVTTGCGSLEVTGSDRLSSATYVYDEASGQLSGTSSSGDTPSGPCNTNTYYYGEAPRTCETATTCSHCIAGHTPSEVPNLCPPPDGP